MKIELTINNLIYGKFRGILFKLKSISYKFYILIFLAIFILFEIFMVFTPMPGSSNTTRIIEIPHGAGLRGIAEILRTQSLIRSQTSFLIMTALKGSSDTLKAGEYEIPPGLSPYGILRILESGKVKIHFISVPEGFTLKDIARILNKENLAREDEIIRLSKDKTFLKSMGIYSNSSEGYLFPDTYQFIKGVKPEEILSKMITRLNEIFSAEFKEKTDKMGFDIHKVLTLASLIEKETQRDDERALISAVFHNRLRQGMPLQSDPTVGYSMKKPNAFLTRQDLQFDSPFNTYRYRGLPPSPIASPGKASIVAALNPAPVKYLYFVAKNDGSHAFSFTLEEHNRAVYRYRISKGVNSTS